MIKIPEEFTKEQEELISIDLIQDKYFAYYNKRIPDSAINIINQISIIADFTRGSNKDTRYNSILFVKITLSSLSNEVSSRKAQLREIAKAVFRSFPYQCFLIFNTQEKVKYCASIFRPYINNQRNNKVEEVAFSPWINNKTSSEKNVRMEQSINNLLASSDNAGGIYMQIYQKLLDNSTGEGFGPWKTPEDEITAIIDGESIRTDSDETDERENDMPEPYEIINSPETEKVLEEYEILKKKALNDPTGESQYLFAKKNDVGTLHRNQLIYKEFLVDSAQRGYPPAIEELASLYESGLPDEKDDRAQPLIKKNLEKALTLYKKINNRKKMLEVMLKLNEKQWFTIPLSAHSESQKCIHTFFWFPLSAEPYLSP